MEKRVAVKIDAKSGAPFVRNFEVLEHLAPNPDSFVDLRYEEVPDMASVRVTARNRHPSKSILAHFYTVNAGCAPSIPGGMTGRIIKASLKPAETAVIHFEEKNKDPQLHLFNARFEEGVAPGGH